MNTANCTLSLAALLFTLAPLRPAGTQDGATKPASTSAQTAQELERRARAALGDTVDKKADEIARRLRGESGATGNVPAGTDEDEDVLGEGTDGEDEDDMGTDDPVLQRLTAIDERLCTIEGLLLDLSARPAPLAGAAPTIQPVAAPVAAPLAAVGSPVTAGFDQARVRVWINGTEATVKLSVNGIPAGRFDTTTNFDLATFLQPGRMNQLAFTIDPRGKGEVSGVSLNVEAQMPGSDDYVAILVFQASKARLSDTLDIPWAPR